VEGARTGAEASQVLGGHLALQRGETEQLATIARQHELDETVTQSTLPVVEQQVSATLCSDTLRGLVRHGLITVNMFIENSNRPRRGRPSGRTAEGEAARDRLYRTAIGLIAERGYAATTLRHVASRAGVSPALLYRYFPNKRAVVLALYAELSDDFARRAVEMPRGTWRDRFVYALALSLEVLGPHRVTLRALVPVMVGDAEEGVFAESTAFSRLRVQSAFQNAVVGAADAPKGAFGEAVGRLLYLLHLAVIMWWLLDRSPSQRATHALVALFPQILPSAALALRLPLVRRFVQSADALLQDALLDGPVP